MKKSSSSILKARNVLVIEDDEDDVFLLKRAFSIVSSLYKISIELVHSQNGMEALAKLAQYSVNNKYFDVLLIDFNMPIMDGMRFLYVVRQQFNYENMRAIVLTTSDQSPVHEAARLAGANDVFVKPSSQRELVNIVKNILDIE